MLVCVRVICMYALYLQTVCFAGTPSVSFKVIHEIILNCLMFISEFFTHRDTFPHSNELITF